MPQGINLDSADLSKLDLRFINFKMANLRKTDLAHANLSNCCLERANLSGAHMDVSNFFFVFINNTIHYIALHTILTGHYLQ